MRGIVSAETTVNNVHTSYEFCILYGKWFVNPEWEQPADYALNTIYKLNTQKEHPQTQQDRCH